MPLPVRRQGAVGAAAAMPVATERVRLLDLSSFTGGFSIPEGDYCLFFDVRIHAYTKADGSKGQENLGVMVLCHPLAGGEALEHFCSLGAKAKNAYMPDPETGKSLVKIPGAPAVNLGSSTNWGLFLKSLVDCGLPAELAESDTVEPIDGVWVHLQTVPSPIVRKRNTAATGEAAQEQQDRGPDMVTLVTEIKDDGKPWENTGGLPDATPAPKPSAAAKGAVKPAAAKPAAAAKKPAPAPEPEAASDDIAEAAADVLGAWLATNPDGGTAIQAKTKAFALAVEKYGDEAAQSIAALLNTAEGMGIAVGTHGYKVDKGKIVTT